MPYSPRFGDHFYCNADGRKECDHVFLEGNSIPERWQDKSQFTIGELGFGTGLNFCETYRQWKATRSNGALHFVSFELYPMQADEIERALAPWPEIKSERKHLVSLWPTVPQGKIELTLDAQTRLTVICAPALDAVLARGLTFDAWYLDGFAPARNPDMWSLDLMHAVFGKTRGGGTFATYAAAGFVRRNLQAAGFEVERRRGFAHKREMLCGRKPA